MKRNLVHEYCVDECDWCGDRTVAALQVPAGIRHLVIKPWHRQSYETDPWYKDTETIAAHVRVERRRRRFNGRPTETFVAAVPVIVTSAAFRSRIGAVTGDDPGPRMVGSPEVRAVILATYDAATGRYCSGTYGEQHENAFDACSAGAHVALPGAVLDWLDDDGPTTTEMS
jgi:hypothetical protein